MTARAHHDCGDRRIYPDADACGIGASIQAVHPPGLRAAQQPAEITAGIRRGFGSVRVAVTVGATSWRTSIFPDSKTGAYLLPVNKAVRTAERLHTGDEIRAQLRITDL